MHPTLDPMGACASDLLAPSLNLRELVRTHVILAPGACGREGQSAGSGTISSRSGGSADVCPSMVLLKVFKGFSQKTLKTLSKPILFEFWPPTQHPQARGPEFKKY